MKRFLLQLMRVPHDPVAPAGSPESVRIFRASPRLYQWNLIQWGALQLAAAIPLTFFFIGMMAGRGKMAEWLKPFLQLGLASLVVVFLLQLLVTFWMQKLDYEMRWYIVTDRSLRIRAGVWSVKEITMTFANIQKVQLSQGPLQKMLNIATVVVSSAGGGAATGPHGKELGDQHAAQFEGVDNAHEIRDIILERLRRYRDAGLGDAATTQVAADTGNEEADAAATVLSAARELRLALQRPSTAA